MKIITRAHSSITERNGANGHTLSRSDKRLDHVNGRPAPESKRPAKDTKPKADNCRTFLPGQFPVELSDGQRQGFLAIAAGRSESASGLPEGAASTKEILLFYCAKGRGWCEIEQNRHEVVAGQLLVVPAKAQRIYGNCWECSWSVIWIQLAAINMDGFVSGLNGAAQISNLGSREQTQMLALFQEALKALEMPCPQGLLQVSQRAMEFLDTSNSSQRENCQIETDSAAKIGRTIEYMKQHLNEPLRAATLAAVANMSLPHYFAQFKRLIGSSPIDYLIKLRMEHARRLLAETSWSVKEVAVSLGYDDPLYFSRVFKSINQAPPSDFRARKRNGE